MTPVLIAEFCQNHKGSRAILQQMIHSAAECGADFAKIQGLRSTELVYRKRFEEGAVSAAGQTVSITRPFDDERRRLASLDLSDEDESWFVKECRRAGIRSMITAFTRGSVSRFAAAGFDAIKIASYDCKSVPLLREAAAAFHEIYVSTGASFDNEVEQASKLLASSQLTLMHCVTLYPTPLTQLHMRRLSWLRELSDRVGFSDHTEPGTTALKGSMLALSLGADAIERHFTILPPHETKDGPISIGPEQLRELKDFASLDLGSRQDALKTLWPQWEVGLGSEHRELSSDELLNRDYYGGRVAAYVDGVQLQNDQE